MHRTHARTTVSLIQTQRAGACSLPERGAQTDAGRQLAQCHYHSASIRAHLRAEKLRSSFAFAHFVRRGHTAGISPGVVCSFKKYSITTLRVSEIKIGLFIFNSPLRFS